MFEGADRWWLPDTEWDEIPNCWNVTHMMHCIWQRSYCGLMELLILSELTKHTEGDRTFLPYPVITFNTAIKYLTANTSLQVLFQFYRTTIANHDSQECKAFGNVRLSVDLFPLYNFNGLTFELEFCMCVGTVCHDHSSPGIESQGHRSMSSTYGHSNTVKRSVWTQSSIEDSFLVFILLHNHICLRHS